MLSKKYLIYWGFFFILFLSSFISAFDWTNNLTAYWKFDETSGIIATDATGHGNNLNWTGGTPQSVAGKIGTALNLTTGTVGIFSNLTSKGYHINDTGFTFSGWISNNSPIITNAQLFIMKDWLGWYPNEAGFLLGFGATSSIRITNGSWFYVTLTYNATSDNMTQWINGIPNGSATQASAIFSELEFFGYDLGTKWNNTADEFGFWNRSLNSSEILELYNSGSGLGYGGEGNSFNIAVDLLSPSNTYQTLMENLTFIANNTITLGNFTNSTVYLWYSNGSLFKTNTTLLSGNISRNTSLLISEISYGNYLWNFRTCGLNVTSSVISCFIGTNNFSFGINPYSINSETHNSSLYETESGTFEINISTVADVSNIISFLYYNGTSYMASETEGGSNIFRKTIDIPLVTDPSIDSENKTFFWQFNITLTDSTILQQNSSIYNHYVNRTYIALCNGTYKIALINFTTKSAENPFPLVNATFKSSWEWYLSTGTGSVKRNLTYEDLNENVTYFNFCAKNYSSAFETISIINYDAAAYSPNFYYLSNASLTNTTQSINLFLLNSSKASVTTLKVRSDAQMPIEDAIINVQLYDVGTGTYYTVSMAKTNFNGEDIVYLNWYDSLYKFVIMRNGEVIKTTNPYKIGETPQIFDILTEITYSFTKFQDFQYNLVYNNATRNFILTYTKPSGEVDQACLRVTKRTAKNDTEICLSCQTSSSATLFCNINGYGNGTYIASFYATGSADLVDWIVTSIGGNFADSIYNLLGVEDASVYALLFGVFVFGFFLITPVLGVIGLVLGLFGAAALGFTTINYLEYFGMLILGGIIIWILKR